MKLSFSIITFVARTFSSKAASTSINKNHYTSLGVKQKATQADIKAAYYKLSMVYHPDKNKNEEDTQKFRDITEAYEVLGNVNLRKLYDKGLYISGTTITTESDSYVNKFYKSRETRNRPPPPSGRTPVYDYDEWTRNHYGSAFKRDREIKIKRNLYENRKIREQEILNVEKVLLGLGLVLIIGMLLSRKTYDNTEMSGNLHVTSRSSSDHSKTK